MWHKSVLAGIVLAGLSGLGRECAGNLTLGVSVAPEVAELGVPRTATVYLTDNNYVTDYNTSQASQLSQFGLYLADVTLAFSDPTVAIPDLGSVIFDPTSTSGNRFNDYPAFYYPDPTNPATVELTLVSDDSSFNPVGVPLDSTGQIVLATFTLNSGAPGTTTITPAVGFGLFDGMGNQINFDPTPPNGDIIQTADVQVVPEASTVVGIITGLCGFLAIFAVRRLRARPQPAVS